MAEPERELLVVLNRGADPSEAVTLAGGRVTQQLADRIALAVVPASGRDTLAGRSDVLGVYDQDVPDSVRDELDEVDRVFVDAWRERGRSKQRVGDGLSWDAPGFQAP